MIPGVDRVGVLVIRIWLEGSGRGSLRARVTRTLDVTRAEQSSESEAAATPEQIVAAVRAWIDAFLSDEGP